MILSCAVVIAACGQDPMKAGAKYLATGDYAAALIEFKNAVQTEPNSVSARLALADASEFSFDPMNAERHLRKAIELGAEPNALVPRIVSLMLDRNELEPLIREFADRHLVSREAESNLRALVALAYASQNRMSPAKEQLLAAAVSTPTVRVAKAQLLLAEGQAQQALAELNTVQEIASLASAASTVPAALASWWTLRAQSRLFKAAGDQPRALASIKKAHEDAPWHHGLTGEYAEALISAGKIADAVPLRDKLLAQAPSYFWTHYLNAVVLSNQGRREDSHAAALKVLAVSPDHLPAVLLASSAELQSGDVQMADIRLRQLLKLYPTSVPALQMHASAQFQQRKISEAQETIRRGLGIVPSDAILLALRAEIEVRSGALNKAAATLETLVSSHPNDAPSLLRLSELKFRQGNKQAATALLDKAVELGREDPMVRDQIVTISMRNGDVARVRKLAEYAIQSRPQDPKSHLVLAAAQGYQRDFAGAWRSTLVALDLQPGFDAALMALAGMAKQPAQRQELRSRFEKAIQNKTSTAQTYLAYVALLRADGPVNGGVAALLEKGVAMHPNAPLLREALVMENLRAGNTDAALSVAQTGASSNNAPVAAAALLASTYERLGKTELATEAYRKLVSSYPQRTDWRLKLAQMEASGNGKVQATTLLRKLISERPFDRAAYVALAMLIAPDDAHEAVAVARELGTMEPHRLSAMLLEGDVLVQSAKTDDALKQYAKAAKAGAEPAAALRIVGLLDRTRRHAAAEEELAITLRKFPEDATVLGYAGQRALSQSKAERAVELLQKRVSKSPGDPVLLNDLAWAQVLAKKPQAMDNASKAVRLLPDNASVLDTLGMAQAQLGKHEEAMLSLRTAVNLAPTAPLPRMHLAELQLASGDSKAAASTLQPVNTKLLSPADRIVLAQLNKRLQN
ncbi:MAG: PEP-CTERM system TPR-repeat protein PrsT [Rhodoferax sp.]|nr:PEP-CTERM system TPR-repeat protein PrsT [Rhodoferax sp.]